MSSNHHQENCSIMRFVGLFSGKWVLPIVYHLIAAKSPVRFNQLQKALSPIPQKELSKQLKLLEKNQLVSKTIYPEIPPRVEYEVTALGQTLDVSIQLLGQWMDAYERCIESSYNPIMNGENHSKTEHNDQF